MYTKGWLALFLVTLLGFTFSRCKDDVASGNGESPSNVVFPNDSVSYNAHVQVLFNQACARAGCHDGGSHQSDLRLTSYGNAVLAIPGIVVPNQPDQSVLVLRIEGRVGTRMPLNLNPLNQNQISGIRRWIAAGALNN
jgi:hypothetical protein